MTNRVELPLAVVDFLRENIQSLEQFELLTLLMKSPQRWWDSAAIGDSLGLTATVARGALEHLASRNLLEITISTDVRYRFQPGTPALRAACELLADLYRTNPVSVLRHVSDTERRAIREFADAFRVRRHDDR